MGRAVAPGLAAHLQIFQNRQRAEDPPFLGHIADPGLGRAEGRHPDQIATLKQHPARTRAHQLDDGFHRRGLARAIAAQQGDDLATLHLQAQIAKDMGLAVEAVDALELKHDRPP